MSKEKQMRAFPVPGTYGAVDSGMSLRDWFAGRAMGAIVGKIPVCGANSAGHVPAIKLDTQEVVAAEIARVAYNYADAMLAERDK